ncbi:MAG TPA: glycine cleavage system protein GcvH [Pontiellaceae bacterium]|nr:glycine cleavage system protein GcvH [Pontiellaceae bacterium]HPR83428.1 glycine cleavage system protein GcvH [Pontiellaceae bacterium]
MSVPNDLYYAKTHEWLRIDDNMATVGITDFAQNQLSDITFVELPDVGREVEAGDEVAVVESVKAASDIYAPVAGTIVEVNVNLEDSPDMINASPYDAGWLFKIEVRKEEDVDNLMSAEEYAESCDEEPDVEED